MVSTTNTRVRGKQDFLIVSIFIIFLSFRYKGVEVNDFTRSWQDGLAFNALIHKFHPELFDYEEILQNTTARNLEHAFSIAKNVFKIDRYLDVEGVCQLRFHSLGIRSFFVQIFFRIFLIKNPF